MWDGLTFAVRNLPRMEYLLILGSWDIVPHQGLNNPVQDADPIVNSDLPYACSAPYSQTISDFLQPTRMVGRIADIIGSNDPAYLEQVLGVAANYKPGTVADYQNIFAISTATWQQSANYTLLELFDGSSTANIVPPSNSSWPQTSLDALLHFIDCHGLQNKPQFLGESPMTEYLAAPSCLQDLTRDLDFWYFGE